jgi:PAS domain S-box-containing protein
MVLALAFGVAPHDLDHNTSLHTNGNHNGCNVNYISILREFKFDIFGNESLFLALSDMLPVAVFIADKNSNLIYTNHIWTKLSGFKAPELKGRPWFDIAHKEDKARLRDSWKKESSSATIFQSTYKILNEETSKVSTSSTVVNTLINDNNDFLGYLGINIIQL